MKIFTQTSLLILLLIGISISLFGSNPKYSLSSLAQDKKVTIFLAEENNEEISVTLSDYEGQVLLSEKIKAGETKQRIYNLKNLPNGEYFFEFKDELEITTETIYVEGSEIRILSTEKTIAPKVYHMDDKLTLSILPFGQKTSITLMSEIGEELYVETIKEQASISKRFDISKLEYGIYTMKILIGKKAFYEKVYVN